MTHNAEKAAECRAACAYGTCNALGSFVGCGGCCGCLGGCLVAYEATLPPLTDPSSPIPPGGASCH